MPGIHILYIIGFMGSGKTTAGKKLASSLGWSFIDLDRKIEKHTGKTIPEIFDDHGEDHFRKIEAEVLRTLSPLSDTVVATGGGAPCYDDNMEFMKSSGLTVYLKLTPNQLVSRLIRSSDERPLIKNLTGDKLLHFIESKMPERTKWYEKSHIIVDGYNLDIRSLQFLIISKLDKEV
ncbi:MAG TPA: shikimate kinase [Bacteroidales bacterium]|nr:shikimate kinase [Bacteroidales bacterium]